MRIPTIIIFAFTIAAVLHAADGKLKPGQTITELGDIDRLKFREPSGITFHPLRKTLFVIGDEGDICEIETDGTPVKIKHIAKLDFEGVTCDPSTGLVYVAVEGKDEIIEMDPENLVIKRVFVIDRNFNGERLIAPEGNGVEAICFVADPAHPEGGTFFLTNQGMDLADKDDPSIIFEAEVPLKSGGTGMARIRRYFSIGVIDLSALYYDGDTGHIYVASDSNDKLYEITKDGDVLNSWDLPGKDQEGIAFDDEGFMYIAQDSGGIIQAEAV